MKLRALLLSFFIVVLAFSYQNCANQISSQKNLLNSGPAQSSSSYLGGQIINDNGPTKNEPLPIFVDGNSNSQAAPQISCSKKTFKVGEKVDCKIINADANTVCWQSGTHAASEKRCVDYGWKLNSDSSLVISLMVVDSMIGDYLIFARNAGGLSNFDLHYQPASVVVPPFVFPQYDFKEDHTSNLSKSIGDRFQCPKQSTQFPGCTFSASGFRKLGVQIFSDPYCSKPIIQTVDAYGNWTNKATFEVHSVDQGTVPKQSGWAIQDITQPGCVGEKGTVVNPTNNSEGLYIIAGIQSWDEAFCIYACMK